MKPYISNTNNVNNISNTINLNTNNMSNNKQILTVKPKANLKNAYINKINDLITSNTP